MVAVDRLQQWQQEGFLLVHRRVRSLMRQISPGQVISPTSELVQAVAIWLLFWSCLRAREWVPAPGLIRPF